MEEKKSNGALIGSIIVIILLVAGAIYLWVSKQDTAMSPTAEQEAVVETYEDLTSIETDLDQELSTIESELDTGLDVKGLE